MTRLGSRSWRLTRSETAASTLPARAVGIPNPVTIYGRMERRASGSSTMRTRLTGRSQPTRPTRFRSRCPTVWRNSKRREPMPSWCCSGRPPTPLPHRWTTSGPSSTWNVPTATCLPGSRIPRRFRRPVNGPTARLPLRSTTPRRLTTMTLPWVPAKTAVTT